MIISAATDYREAAKRKLPRFLFDYLDGGSYAEMTLRNNVSDLSSLALRQRILKNVADLSLETELFGEKMAMPVGLAPVGLGGMYARRGEVKTLSQQTEKATREITAKVQQIQNDAIEATSAIAGIVSTISELRSGADDIARSVAAQQMATSQIAETVESLAEGSQSVGNDIDSVRDVADETGQVASVVFEEAKSVSRASDQLKMELARFLANMRAA